MCGDPWNGPHDHEEGGKYAKGIIVREYLVWTRIPVTVDLTANIKGWFEFRICAKDDPNKKTTHECLDKHLLKEVKTGISRWVVPKKTYGQITIMLQLPRDLVCKACVLQWKYNGGTHWGKDPKTDKECVGCGPQDEFYGCADVSVVKEKSDRQIKAAIGVESMAAKPGLGLGWLFCLVFSLALKKLYFGII